MSPATIIATTGARETCRVEITCATQEDLEALAEWIFRAVKSAVPDADQITMSDGFGMRIVNRMRVVGTIGVETP